MTNNAPTPTPNQQVTTRVDLARSATALMAVTIREVFPDATAFTVEITERGGCLVAVHSAVRVLWMVDMDEDPTGDLAKVDDLLWCARSHVNLDHSALPSWTAAPVDGCVWNAPDPRGNGDA